MMQLLEIICPNVIYIGGNHLPITIFAQPYPSMSVNSINLHQGFVTFDTNLYVSSVAGAVHAVDATSDLEAIVWNGFPYNQMTYFLSYEAYTNDLHALLDRIDEDIKIKKPINPKIILLSHCRPYEVKTTYSKEKTKAKKSMSRADLLV